MTTTLKGLGKLSLALLLAASLNGVALAGVAPVEGSAALKSPAGNVAVVAKLIGLVNNRVEKTLTGTARTINDGVVIRQSYIKDGKIIIPAEGLYTTARSSNWYPFDNEPITINGKTYRVIVDRYTRDVVRNVVMKKGQVITSNEDKSRGWELSSVGGWTSFGMPNAYTATFKIVKTTGNYYGSAFPVQVGSMIANTVADGSLVKGGKEVEGNVVPTAENGLSRFIDGTNIATTGRSHVIVDKIDDKGNVHVRELATDSCTDLFISPSEPVVAAYAEGASFMIGDAKVAVKKLGKDSVEVSITDKSGAMVSKKLFIDSANAQWLVMSMVERENCYLVSKDGKTIVHLNIRPGNPFKDGKVDLVAYSDVVRVQNGTDWVSDTRFLARPET
ncbi:MAG: hypothetical protein IKL99_00615 [Oscillospiraceae bacterium]|nr:hypothetical protein [Oscillospiraceae bacterium]